MSTFDHGELNIPGRLKNLDRDIDRGLAEIAKAERAKQRDLKADRVAARKAEADRPKFTRDDLVDAVIVRDRFGWHRVHSVNAKTVTVATAFSWTERIPFDRVLDHRTP